MNLTIRSILFFLIAGAFLLTTAGSACAQTDGLDTGSSRLYYSGTLGGSSQIEFNMQVAGYAVSGSYIVVNSGEIYVFKGRLSADKSGMGVLIYDDANNYIASMEATVISREMDFASEITGTWKSGKTNTRKAVDLIKVAEFARAISNDDPYAFSE